MNKIVDKSIEEQITCPHCGMMNCYITKYDELDVYLCFSCGYTSNSKMVIGSEYVDDHFTKSGNVAQFIKDIHFNDTERNLIWYPTVLQFPDLGVIFPEPDGADWGWTYVKETEVLDEEKEKYKISGTNEYYKTKLDMNEALRYNKYDFYSACIDMGVVKPPTQEIN